MQIKGGHQFVHDGACHASRLVIAGNDGHLKFQKGAEALDKQAIVDQIFGGFAAIDKGQLLSPSVLGFNDSLDAYPYDADKAKQMIKDAGCNTAGDALDVE